MFSIPSDRMLRIAVAAAIGSVLVATIAPSTQWLVKKQVNWVVLGRWDMSLVRSVGHTGYPAGAGMDDASAADDTFAHATAHRAWHAKAPYDAFAEAMLSYQIDPDQALPILKHVTEQQPQNASALAAYLDGNIHRYGTDESSVQEGGELAHAIPVAVLNQRVRLARRGEELEPQNGWFVFSMINALWQLGQRKEALAALNRAAAKPIWNDHSADIAEAARYAAVHDWGEKVLSYSYVGDSGSSDQNDEREEQRICRYAVQLEKAGRPDEGLRLRFELLVVAQHMASATSGAYGAVHSFLTAMQAISTPAGSEIVRAVRGNSGEQFPVQPRLDGFLTFMTQHGHAQDVPRVRDLLMQLQRQCITVMPPLFQNEEQLSALDGREFCTAACLAAAQASLEWALLAAVIWIVLPRLPRQARRVVGWTAGLALALVLWGNGITPDLHGYPATSLTYAVDISNWRYWDVVVKFLPLGLAGMAVARNLRIPMPKRMAVGAWSRTLAFIGCVAVVAWAFLICITAPAEVRGVNWTWSVLTTSAGKIAQASSLTVSPLLTVPARATQYP